jgi:arylsulfatase A-like enzyme
MPTMLTAIGAPIPVQCDGEDLSPFLRGQTPAGWRTEAHWEYEFRDPANDEAEVRFGVSQHQCAMNIIRGERYKYVHFTSMPPLLFDLEIDPNETTNRIDDPDYLRVTLTYAQKLLSWRMNHDEQTLTHMTLTEDGVVSRPSPRYPERGR